MEEWPRRTKQRLLDVIREIAHLAPLPKRGHALDFGCGRGVLTEVLRAALPGWKIVGTDLSEVALTAARVRVSGCEFINGSDPALSDSRFDFIFSHHTLEHVSCLEPVYTAFSRWVRPGGAMLHVLPCGNPGSLEYALAELCQGGIDPTLGNRFFYEDPGHVRRLTSAQLTRDLAAHEFTPLLALFNNHHDGGIEWMTAGSIRFLVDILDPSRARTEEGAKTIRQLRRCLVGLAISRWPAIRLRSLRRRRNPFSSELLRLMAVAPVLPISIGIDLACRRRAAREWLRRRHDPAGSEMFVSFRRNSLTSRD